MVGDAEAADGADRLGEGPDDEVDVVDPRVAGEVGDADLDPFLRRRPVAQSLDVGGELVLEVDRTKLGRDFAKQVATDRLSVPIIIPLAVAIGVDPLVPALAATFGASSSWSKPAKCR